jgi:hypothetical protein
MMSCCEKLTLCVQYNLLDANLPHFDGVPAMVVRSAGIGFSAATAAAVSSNWARVIKTCKQTSPDPNISYSQVLLRLRLCHSNSSCDACSLPHKFEANSGEET